MHQDQVLNTKEVYLPQRDKGQGIKDTDWRQRSRESEKGQGTGKNYLPPKDKRLLDREETDVAQKQMAFYKGKGETPRLGRAGLIWHVNWGSQKGVLEGAGLQSFDSWALVPQEEGVGIREGPDLGGFGNLV